MLDIYLPILVVIGVAFAFALGSVTLSRLVGVKKPSEVKLAPYECGMPLIGSAQERFSIKFYIIAMLFILFDIEAVFLYHGRSCLNASGYSVLLRWVCSSLSFSSVISTYGKKELWNGSRATQDTRQRFYYDESR